MDPKQKQFSIWYVFIALWALMLIQIFVTPFLFLKPMEIPYSEFKAAVAAGKVEEVSIGSAVIHGRMKPDPSAPTKEGRLFDTVRVEDPDLIRDLQAHQVKITGVIESTFLRDLLSWVIPIGLFFAVWLFLLNRMGQGQGGFMTVGRSKAKIYMEKEVKVTFDDVAGVDEAKEELREVIDFLKTPEKFTRLGGKIPKGILLVGPPGTGKTLLARAVAGEAGVTFFSISGSEFVEMFVGVGAARVRDLFEQAKSKAPCIIFIDELDALGRARGAVPGLGGHDEKEQTLNQLLVEMDGFDPTSGIVLIAATNRPEILDPALLRAGRFDRQVLVDRPDRIGREEILRVHTRKVLLAADVKLEEVAALTPGFTGADLANLVNEAALVATRGGADRIAMNDFNLAIERIVAGLEKKNRLLNPREREIVAHHEMGHALVAAALPGTDAVHKISIIPRGIGALGYTIQRPTEDRYLMTREELDNKMAVLLGGRAAEHLVFGHLSTGAADDLAKVTDIARSMVTRFGMGAALGPVTYESEPTTFLGQAYGSRRLYAEETAREIDVAVRGIVEAQFHRAQAILVTNRAVLADAAGLLLANENISGVQLDDVLRRVGKEVGPRLAAAATA